MGSNSFKIFVSIVGVVFLSLVLFVCGFALVRGSHFYTRQATVANVDYVSNVVVVNDISGNSWLFIGADNWETGDKCKLIMNDNDTKTTYDDEIVLVKHCN